jgi:CRISPR-associated endonuclease/helicase Cas3
MDGYIFSDAYPLLSISNKSEIKELPLASQERLKRTFRVEFKREESDVIELLKKCSESGNCGVWIRNTVGEVQRSYEELVRILGPDRVLIFHSRYTMEDRQTHEEQVLTNFGRNSVAANRNGKILLSSQVVEQSLDLDFDVMVSDLAPIDLLIQRAGRLQRHVRNVHGDPAQLEERPAPVLYIHGPDPDENQTEGWFREFSNNASFVYKRTGILWKSAKVLKKEGKIELPGRARFLIESVYNEYDPLHKEIPDAVLSVEKIAERKDREAGIRGELATLPLDVGYIRPDDSSPLKEEKVRTRLTEDTSTYVLCLKKDGEIVPFAASNSFAIPMSEIKYRKVTLHYSEDLDRLAARFFEKNKAFLRGKSLLIVEPQDEEYRSRDQERIFVYSRLTGLGKSQ